MPILIDEAYNELTDKPDYTSMVDLVREGANVLITRTFSKIFGMAGLRVGYGMGHPDLVKVVKDHVMAWPNGVGLYAAYHSYLDDAFIDFFSAKDPARPGDGQCDLPAAWYRALTVANQFCLRRYWP